MTLSAALLTLGIYGNGARKRHLEAHKYCRRRPAVSALLEQDHSPGTAGAGAAAGLRGEGRRASPASPASLAATVGAGA